ncbi:MAG: PKD domain-containing protein [Solirubrobacteraceae bacterium]
MPHVARRLMFALAAMAGLWLLIAVPVSAKVATVPTGSGVEEVKVGLQPREVSHYWEGDVKLNGLDDGEAETNLPALSFANNPSDLAQPGPVLHSAATYLIYWDPQDYYHGDWQGLIDGFMANIGSADGQLSSVFAVDSQYTDETNRPATSRSIFHGAYTDTNPYPAISGCTDPHRWVYGIPLLEGGGTVCLTDAQIKAQLETFIAQHGLQKGMGSIFYLLTPPGVTACLDAGGPSGRCSDFDGTITEIATYEEEKNTYPERLGKYEEEKETYEKEKKQYEAEKLNDEKKGETDTDEPPVEPTKLTPLGKPPASYADYRESFCSYHSAISPTNPESGDGDTILYAVIPWVAGGEGDYHVSAVDNTQGFDCQDGGFAPDTKTNDGELGEKEHTKIRTAKEQEEFDEKSKKEQREIEEAKELGLEKPHEQEPNQLGSVRGPDGTFDTGLADLIINQIAVEQQDIVTNPLLNAWQDPVGDEVTDECRNFFFAATGNAGANPKTVAGWLSNQSLGEDKYYLNDAFNLAAFRLPYPAIPCLSGIALAPKFTAPNTVNAGELVGFDGMESDITLNDDIGYSKTTGAEEAKYATYKWNFGDETAEITGVAPGAPSLNSPETSPCELPWQTPCAASTFHSYRYGGTYSVTLTVTDTGGNTASVAEPITVVGPPPPPPPGSGGSSNTGANNAPGGSGGSGNSSSIPSVPGPIATAAAVSSSLKQVAKNGLVVRYTVNEQVAGRFEVLLESATAHHLGISGPAATNLPAGSPRSLVIGHALLVTTKAGKSSVRIKFSKSVAKHLRRAKKVKLTLRLTAHNANSQTPLFTTVISTVELHH